MIIEKNIGNSNDLLTGFRNTAEMVTEDALSNVASITKEFSKDELVYENGHVSDKIYLIEEGSVKIAKTDSSGKEVVKAILNTGNVFGEKALSGDRVRAEYAQVVTADTRVKVFMVEDVLQASRQNAQLNQKVIDILAKKLEGLEKRLESITSKDSRTRVVDFLRDLALENGQKVGFETLIKNNFTHKDIASLTGTSRQTVTTTLNHLKEKNIINFDRRRILIRDMDLLV
ncbi:MULTISPECIES: Crp/Fnr family transcriptional regulator [Reichenbachiella]|uniref:cAMP-binding domain of CRP or a regulatory subunit of cAMP-dependent protein kinases n=1 Tax=Reichenbachiella agariperforans TaxID=156994 RepID=A0A1M6LAE6_REIAG|nr:MULTISPECIES: Crp/Fnr family transcriptional regulator [Reichenbachiella]MBU2913850.1 Crp/Fnr family transcriptional regulator [Reichenbachiella agariperforans]SHJ68132.1 cAMP-binding domain of CRP or a regulatory subunit of cAMP-dependent protein kinases [Reichenbachiella agariperforans]